MEEYNSLITYLARLLELENPTPAVGVSMICWTIEELEKINIDFFDPDSIDMFALVMDTMLESGRYIFEDGCISRV